MTEHEHPEVAREAASDVTDAPDPTAVADEAEPADVPEASQEGDPVRTGVADVDAVLESVEGLEGRPLEEHVAVFEDAHGRLRRALDDPGS
jgi:hypothetical protein